MHLTHTFDEDTPNAVEYMPAAQTLQFATGSDAPIMVEKVPAPHCLQAVAASWVL